MRKKMAGMGKRWVAFVLAAAMMTSVQGVTGLSEMEGVKAAEREMPKNPVHHCMKEDDGSDYTEWS